MGIHANIRGLSTITLILLVILSTIIGGLISYAFTIAYYAKIPEETTLAITGVYINKENVRSFNITVLNPSYSPKDAKITRIALSLKNGTQLYDVVETNPPLIDGLKIPRGEAINITCLKIKKDNINMNFGEFVNTFAGETILVHVFAEGSPAANMEVTLPHVKLNIIVNFNRQFYESIEYFNLTIENSQPEPLMNLTISEVYVDYESVETQPSLPYPLMPNQNETFKCLRNWDSLKWVKVKIVVKTMEGYEATYTTNELPGAAIYIDEIKFDYDNTDYVNVTVTNSKNSTDIVYINRVELTLENEPPRPLNTSFPTNVNYVPAPLPPNKTLTLKCIWNWHHYRNKTIIFTVYTKQGIRVQSHPFTTPLDIVWEISGVNFDLDNLEFFTINITNKGCSQNITVTNIKLNGKNVTIVDPPTVVRPGQQVTLNCSFSWGNLTNTNVTVSVAVVDIEGHLRSENSKEVWISPVKLSILEEGLVFGEFVLANSTIIMPYINVTVHNSINSRLNVTITKIVFEIGYESGTTLETKTIDVDGGLSYPRLLPNGYMLATNGTVTFICFSNWSLYLTPAAKYVTVVIYTEEGFQASKTWHR